MKRTLFAVMLLGFVLCLSAGVAQATKEEKAGIFSYTKGIVTIQRGGNNLEVAKGDPVYFNDTVKTAGNSSAVIDYTDKVRTCLGEKTELLIPQDQGKKKKTGVISVLKLMGGKLLAKVQKRKDPFEVRTPSAICGVKGTSFQVDVDREGKTILTVFEGLMNFSNALGAAMVKSSCQSNASMGIAPLAAMVVDLDKVETPDVPMEMIKGIIKGQMEKQLKNIPGAGSGSPSLPGGGGFPF